MTSIIGSGSGAASNGCMNVWCSRAGCSCCCSCCAGPTTSWLAGTGPSTNGPRNAVDIVGRVIALRREEHARRSGSFSCTTTGPTTGLSGGLDTGDPPTLLAPVLVPLSVPLPPPTTGPGRHSPGSGPRSTASSGGDVRAACSGGEEGGVVVPASGVSGEWMCGCVMPCGCAGACGWCAARIGEGGGEEEGAGLEGGEGVVVEDEDVEGVVDDAAGVEDTGGRGVVVNVGEAAGDVDADDKGLEGAGDGHAIDAATCAISSGSFVGGHGAAGSDAFLAEGDSALSASEGRGRGTAAGESLVDSTCAAALFDVVASPPAVPADRRRGLKDTTRGVVGAEASGTLTPSFSFSFSLPLMAFLTVWGCCDALWAFSFRFFLSDGGHASLSRSSSSLACSPFSMSRDLRFAARVLVAFGGGIDLAGGGGDGARTRFWGQLQLCGAAGAEALAFLGADGAGGGPSRGAAAATAARRALVGEAARRSVSDSDSVCEVCGSDGRARLRAWVVVLVEEVEVAGDEAALGLGMRLAVEVAVEDEATGVVCSTRRALRRTAASGEGGSEPEGPAAAAQRAAAAEEDVDSHGRRSAGGAQRSAEGAEGPAERLSGRSQMWCGRRRTTEGDLSGKWEEGGGSCAAER
ncbi:hypothetical protein BJ912DRAFT_960601 [Pholiota molesta]|nr:hypothetical protein BJ912DRAFT_960601 [Pholiota molesta]